MDTARTKQPKYRELRQNLRLLCGHSRNCTGQLGTLTRIPPQFAPVTGFVLTLNAAYRSEPCEGGETTPTGCSPIGRPKITGLPRGVGGATRCPISW